MLEQRDIGWGSTAASTALLQYEIDTHLVDLAKRYGEADAVLAYRACVDAIPMLQALAAGVRDVGFARRDSLYYASRRRHRAAARRVRAARAGTDSPVRVAGARCAAERYGFDAPARSSARRRAVDPYRLALRLLARGCASGGSACSTAPR